MIISKRVKSFERNLVWRLTDIGLYKKAVMSYVYVVFSVRKSSYFTKNMYVVHLRMSVST